MSFGESQPVATLAIYFVRTVLFWPISHAIFTGLAGAALGFALGRPGSRSPLWAALCLLGAYGIRRVVSSPAVRCTQTVEPFAHSISTFLEIDDRLSEDTRASQVQRSMDALLDRKSPVVLCTHRPTLSWIFDSVRTQTHDLAPGEAVVLHHRRGELFATETLA
jgi:hypothetical protein